MYKLTIESESLDEIYATISTLKGKANVTLADASDEPAPKKDRKKKETVVSQDNTPEQANEPAIQPDAIDYAAVKNVTLALVKAKGKPTALAVLEKFGVKGAQDLKPEQWAEFVQAATAELEKPMRRL